MITVSTIVGAVRRSASADGAASSRDRRSTEDGADVDPGRVSSSESINDVGALLRSIGVLVDEPDRDGLALEPTFGAAWRTRIERVRETESRLDVLARQLDLEPDQVALEVASDGFVATCGRDRVGRWPSDGAFLADLAAVSVLSETNADWLALDADERRLALTALRLFLERCPNCDGPLSGARTSTDFGDETAKRRSVACDRCGSVLFRESA